MVRNVKELAFKATLEKGEYISWAAFHACHQPATAYVPAVISLLPMFYENAHSIAMILHAMNMIKAAVNHVNPGQTPVITLDQPLFALGKLIQWSWPSTHCEKKFVLILGGLHIEMASFKLLGDWLDGSGWTSALVAAEVATGGVADSLIKATHIARTRRVHQVTAGSLFILQSKAYGDYLENLEDGEEPLQFTDWVNKMSEDRPQFLYWNRVLLLELCVLQLVRATREGDFSLYNKSLVALVPWMFSLDHINYARWLSVHIRDMCSLPSTHPDIHQELTNGSFVVHKTENVFSSIALDHAHEHVNAQVKGEGGAVGLTENPAALRRWMIAGPEIARIIQEFEQTSSNEVNEEKRRHHEQVPSVQASFKKDVLSLVSAIEEMGNPFEEDSTDLLVLDSKEIMDDTVVKTVKEVITIGQSQYNAFVKERFQERTKPVTEAIKKNKLPLFREQPQKGTTKDKQKVAALKNDCALFSRLYIACQSRDGNLEEFFKYENQPFPPSLAQGGKIREGQKSDLVRCMERLVESKADAPQVEATIIDGAVIVQILKPGMAATFKEYADFVFKPYVFKQLEAVKRVDVVWDVYREDSLKSTTRERRGAGTRRRVTSSSRLPKNWKSFLHVSDNKTELFLFLAKELQGINIEGKEVHTTYGELTLSSPPTEMMECSHEEADTRLMLHAYHASQCGYRKILIRTVDTDVVVLAVSRVQDLGVDEIWIAFGTGKHFRYLPVHSIAEHLGPQRSRALPVFHSITGCDTVSFFSGRGKTSAWDVWNVFPQITDTFAMLAAVPDEIPEEAMGVIERFVVLLYSRASSQMTVNKARQDLFSKGKRTIENIPPSQAALLQHTKRAVFQAGHIWANALVPKPTLPSPSDWRWEKDGKGWKPVWTLLRQAQQMCYELIHCGCKKGCTRRCKCVKASLACTALCDCGGACNQDSQL